MADDNIKDVGFAISTPSQDMLEENARERPGRELTDEDWEVLNDDIGRIENNFLKLLDETLDSARDEGHGGKDGEELIGTAWYDPDNKEQLDFVMERTEWEDSPDIDRDLDVYKGVSELGLDVMGSDARVEFFDVPEEDYEAWEDDN